MVRVPSARDHLDVVIAEQSGRAVEQLHALALEQPGRALLQALLDPLDALGQRRDVDLGVLLLEAHAVDAPREAHRPAGGDHRLRRDAVPQVRGAADDVALDHRDLGAEAGGVCRRGVARRTAADDHESSCHRDARLAALSRRRSAQPSLANMVPRLSVGRGSAGVEPERFEPPPGTLGQYRDGYRNVLRAFADPLEVHAVGVDEVAAPREVVGPEDAHHTTVHLRHTALAVGDVLMSSACAHVWRDSEPSCVPTIRLKRGPKQPP